MYEIPAGPYRPSMARDPPAASASSSAGSSGADAMRTIGAELAVVRLRHRELRLERALRELRGQARAHRASRDNVPPGLVRALRDFELELGELRLQTAGLVARVAAAPVAIAAAGPRRRAGRPGDARRDAPVIEAETGAG